MFTKTLRRIVMAVALVLTPAMAGCVYDPYPNYPESYDGYEPLVHDNGCVIYYDSAGEPYYYGPGARIVYIERGTPYYTHYVHYYRTHRPHYARWYHARGYRYRTARYHHWRR